jgi:hypothetical protein
VTFPSPASGSAARHPARGRYVLTARYNIMPTTETVLVNGARVRVADLPPDIRAAIEAELAAPPPWKRHQDTAPKANGSPPLAHCGPKAPVNGSESDLLEIGRLRGKEVASLPQASMLERAGEDLMYLAGVWRHRCAECGAWECLLERKAGTNPSTVWVPAGWVPRTESVKHDEGCLNLGAF